LGKSSYDIISALRAPALPAPPFPGGGSGRAPSRPSPTFLGRARSLVKLTGPRALYAQIQPQELKQSVSLYEARALDALTT